MSMITHRFKKPVYTESDVARGKKKSKKYKK